MNNIVKFPEKIRVISKADKLLQQFVDICLIEDRTTRKEAFDLLRVAIFAYVSTIK